MKTVLGRVPGMRRLQGSLLGCVGVAALLMGASMFSSLAGPPISLSLLPQPNPAYGLGNSPYAAAIADLDHDGLADLLTANNGSDSISVLRGKGDGTFYQATNYGVGHLPYAIAVADFNHDNHLDFVSSSTTVWFGAGDGSFNSPITNLTGGLFPDLVASDLNGDGHADFAVVNSAAFVVMVFFGDGAGGFPTNTSFAVAEVQCLTVGDFTGDGHLDILTANNSNNGSVSLLPGDGSGGFGPITNYNNFVLGRPQSVVAGDLDGDDQLDVVTASSGSGVVKVFHGNGNGTFVLLTNLMVMGPRAAILSDLNGDTLPDIVANADQTYVFTGLGGGRFSKGVRHDPKLGGSSPRGVTATDLDGDGRVDLIIGASGSSPGPTLLAVFLNTSRPELLIDAVQDNFRLSWPNWAFALEARTNLWSGSDWSPILELPVEIEGRNVLTNLSDGPARFYRLNRQ